MTEPTVVEFLTMTVMRWKGWYICCDEQCPGNNGEPHVWATKTKPTHNSACGKCKRITWNRDDKRFTVGRPRKRSTRKGRK